MYTREFLFTTLEIIQYLFVPPAILIQTLIQPPSLKVLYCLNNYSDSICSDYAPFCYRMNIYLYALHVSFLAYTTHSHVSYPVYLFLEDYSFPLLIPFTHCISVYAIYPHNTAWVIRCHIHWSLHDRGNTSWWVLRHYNALSTSVWGRKFLIWHLQSCCSAMFFRPRLPPHLS